MHLSTECLRISYDSHNKFSSWTELILKYYLDDVFASNGYKVFNTHSFMKNLNYAVRCFKKRGSGHRVTAVGLCPLGLVCI